MPLLRGVSLQQNMLLVAMMASKQSQKGKPFCLQLLPKGSAPCVPDSTSVVPSFYI